MNTDRLDLILAALCEFEAGQGGAMPPQIRKFVHRKAWLASDRIIGRLALALFMPVRPPIPGLFRKHILGLVAGRISSGANMRALATSADGMQIKPDGTRLRAFFLPSSLFPGGGCVKIVPTDKTIAARTRHELSVRRRLADMGTIAVPAIAQVDETDSHILVLEELIMGQRFRIRKHEDLFCGDGMAALLATYRAFGVRWAPLGDFYPTALSGDIEGTIRALDGGADFLGALGEAATGSVSIPVSMCHRDLLPSNLCVANGKLYFFDWEMAAEGPVFSDLMQLSLRYPDRQRLMQAVVRLFSNEFGIRGPDLLHMFTALMAGRIAAEPAKAAKFVEIWNSRRDIFS